MMKRYQLLVAGLALFLGSCATAQNIHESDQTAVAHSPGTVIRTPSPAQPTTTSLQQSPTVVFSPTPEHVQYNFGSGVTPQQRQLIQSSIELATSYLGQLNHITVNADSDFYALAKAFDAFYHYPDGSAGSLAFRKSFAANGSLAVAENSIIWIWVSSAFSTESLDNLTHSIVHEYFHLLQGNLSRRYVAQTGPVWLYEGAADLAGYSALESKHSKITLAQVHADRVTGSRGMLSPLSAMVTPQQAQSEVLYPYYIGYLAVEYLTNRYAGGKLTTLEEFWSAQASGISWQSAFQKVFGLSASDFYDDFELYREKEFPPFCGKVGTSYPDTTTSGPFTIQLALRSKPGEMFELDAPWTDSPNIPYVFCVPGMRLRQWPPYIYNLPPESAGSAICGGGCVTVYMKPTAPAGMYNFSIKLPDQRHAEISFDHRP